jgi:glutamate-1-semialdehyde 2,1-aminomutase
MQNNGLEIKLNRKKSFELFERAKKYTPSGVHSPVRAFKGVGGVPVFIEKAQGSKLFDVDGNEYIDFCMSWGPLIFGHQDSDVKEEVIKALNRGWSFGAAEKYSLELAELMVNNIQGLESVRFVNSGTEAVMSALRLARAATNRNKILKFEGCYHGHVDSMLTKAGSGLADMSEPDSAGITKTVAQDTLVAPLNDFEAVKKIFERHGSEIAVCIIEPLPANNGLLIQKKEFLEFLRKITKEHGALLLFDEVISGFRVGFQGMSGILNIIPDLFTYGKVIGGGFPVGAFGGRKDLMELIAPSGPVYQAGTLSANPVAMTAGFVTLKKLLNKNIYENLERKTNELCNELNLRIQKKSLPFKIQNFGSIFWCVCDEVKTEDRLVRSLNQIPPRHKENFIKIFHALLDLGVYFAPSAFEVSFLSTAHLDSDLEKTINAFEKALNYV